MNTAENLHYLPGHEPTSAPEVKKGAQLEDGYVRTSNTIVEAFAKAPLTSREGRIIRAVERATFGWQRPTARLSQSVLAKMTELTPKRCSETVNSLLKKKVLIRDGGSQSPIGINTRVSEWNFGAEKSRNVPKSGRDPKWGQSPQIGDEKRPQSRDTDKERKDIEPIGSKSSSKKASPKKWGEPVDHELSELMFSRVTEGLTNPRRPNMDAWANEMRLMRTSDKRTEDQIRYLINWVARDEFWSSVIMSPAKLRKKWDQLEKKVIAYKESRNANGKGTDANRAERDRVAAMLADPNDSSWIDGLFDEEGASSGAGEQDLHPAGSDLPENVADVIHDRSDAEAGQARGRCFDGELVDAADNAFPGHGDRANQAGGRGVAAEHCEADQAASAEAGGFWNA